MKDILAKNFNWIYNNHKEIFDVLYTASKIFGFEVFLIGAQLRDAWINHLNIRKRISEDIDFSICIGSINDWEKIRTHLVIDNGFVQDSGKPYRFILGEIQVDIIPFEDSNTNSIIMTPPEVNISVVGFSLVKEQYLLVEEKYKLLTPPALCILKLISYSEKPYSRRKDIEDFILILKEFEKIEENVIFEQSNIEYILEYNDVQIAAAHILGKKIREIIGEDEGIKEKIITVLKAHISIYTEDEIENMYKDRLSTFDDKTEYKLITELLKELS